jgi:hypothetical protein
LIIAIDPGPVQSAMVWWNGKEVHQHEILPNEDLLRFIYSLPGGTLVIEMVARRYLRRFFGLVGFIRRHPYLPNSYTGRRSRNTSATR